MARKRRMKSNVSSVIWTFCKQHKSGRHFSWGITQVGLSSHKQLKTGFFASFLLCWQQGEEGSLCTSCFLSWRGRDSSSPSKPRLDGGWSLDTLASKYISFDRPAWGWTVEHTAYPSLEAEWSWLIRHLLPHSQTYSVLHGQCKHPKQSVLLRVFMSSWLGGAYFWESKPRSHNYTGLGWRFILFGVLQDSNKFWRTVNIG